MQTADVSTPGAVTRDVAPSRRTDDLEDILCIPREDELGDLVATTLPNRVGPTPRNVEALDDFFVYGPQGVEVDEGLVDVRFGEFLVERGDLDRGQLLCALQLQDRRPGWRVGVCAVALGFLGRGALARAIAAWESLAAIEV
ncbi:MAG TPA: hypothetical protein VHE35_07590 [Kofleriaceae bacterium]|nr:hypothetical protein [Kofleriaceae bacterium]